MGMVALEQRIASAYVIIFGVHGEISRQAQERGVSRQRVYREHAGVVTAVAGTAWQQEKEALQRRVEELQERNAALQERLSQAIVLDKDKQKEFASVAQAVGVGLPTCRTLLEVLLGKRAPKVSTLGRWTKAAGKKAGELLAVLDEFTYDRVKQAVEVHVGGGRHRLADQLDPGAAGGPRQHRHQRRRHDGRLRGGPRPDAQQLPGQH